MKFYDEFKETRPGTDSTNSEPSMKQFIEDTGMSFDDAEDSSVLTSYFDWLVGLSYSHQTVRRYYKNAKLYTQFVNKKNGKQFDTEGLVDVAKMYRNTDLAYLFYEDLMNDIEDEIDSWVDNRNQYDDNELLRDYFTGFKATVSLLWFGFQIRYITSIHRDDVDLENHTVCGIHIYNPIAWECIKEQYFSSSYHRVLFDKIVESDYFDNGFLFRYKTKPKIYKEPISIKTLQNEMQAAYRALDIPRLSANEITLFGFMSRFIKTEHGLESLYDNKEALFEYITDNMKTLDSAGAVFNHRFVYDKFDLYRIKLLKYLIKAVDIESKL